MTEAFNPFEGYVRAPHLDQPYLQSSIEGFELDYIPAQVGFIAPSGAEVQISYERAVQLGLIAQAVVGIVPIDRYVKSKK